MTIKPTLSPLGDARFHYWMTIRMGDALGLPLTDAWENGRISPEEYAAMITRCRTCSEPGACAQLLEHEVMLKAPPGYCANGEVWAELAEDTPERDGS